MQIKNLKDPIVVAPSPTPFNKNDSVNYSAIEKNVSKWLETPLTGFVLGSENGEESFLSLEEKIKIVSTVSQVNSGEKIVIGGVDNPSTIETIKESEKLVRSGADLIRIRIPRNRDSVMPYFESVLDKIPVPVLVIHQMAPGNFDSSMTQIGASPEEIGIGEEINKGDTLYVRSDKSINNTLELEAFEGFEFVNIDNKNNRFVFTYKGKPKSLKDVISSLEFSKDNFLYLPNQLIYEIRSKDPSGLNYTLFNILTILQQKYLTPPVDEKSLRKKT